MKSKRIFEKAIFTLNMAFLTALCFSCASKPSETSTTNLAALGDESAGTQSTTNLATLDEALTGAAEAIIAIIPQGTEMAIPQINASHTELSNFLSEELKDRLYQLMPDIAELYSTRGIFYLTMEADNEAIADFTNAIRLNANHAIDDDNRAIRAIVYNNRAFVYNRRRDYDCAIEDLNEGLRIMPDMGAFYNNLGYAYIGKGDYDRAIEYLNQAIQLDKNFFSEPYNNRGYAYERKGDRNRANADFEAARRAMGFPTDWFMNDWRSQ